MPNDIQLGHALRMTNEAWDRGRDLSEISAEALRIAAGLEKLVARAPAPQFREAVEHAERQIGIDPHDPERPVYAYIGDLHAHLGQVGLVFHRAWARRCLHGFTRCDSGGMVGGFGNFAHTNPRPEHQTAAARVRTIEPLARAPYPDFPARHTELEAARRDLAAAAAERDRAVRSLTVLASKKPNVVEILDYELDRELAASYADVGDLGDTYVRSFPPRVAAGFDERYRSMLPHTNLNPIEQAALANASDPRRLCVEGAVRARVPQDRRAWTWEVRMSDSPTPDDLCAVLLSPEGSKVFLSERLKERVRRTLFAAIRDGTEGTNTVQTLAPEVAPHVKIITAGANQTFQRLSGLDEHTGAAPWFYSREARAVLRRCQ